mgnify:CR=1 FL=1
MRARLFSYKLANDSGFAPNPFHGFLTLANCKPQIRRSKKIGDWIAGFTSKQLNNDAVGEEKLIYLMKVTNKIDYNEYWNNPKYSCKKPNTEFENNIGIAGDNIYKPDGFNRFLQIENKNHGKDAITHDLGGQYVLISEEFYYFGESPIEIPSEFRPSIPKGQSSQGNRTHDNFLAESFIHFIQSNYSEGINNMPHLWSKKHR